MRSVRTVVMVLLPLWIVACSAGGDTPIASRKIVPDPGGGVYLGVFPCTHAVFEEAIGRQASMVGEPSLLTYYYNERGEEFHRLPEVDIDALQAEIDQGRIPKTTMGPWFCQESPAAFTVQGVIDGEIDKELRDVARSIAEWGGPIFWSYSVEPLPQFPGHGEDGQECRWGCDQWEGFQGNLCEDGGPDLPEHYTQYGDPARLDSAERYIDFYRHIHDVVEGEIERLGLPSNITWVAGHGTPDQSGKLTYEQFWVGEDYVDWHAYGYYAGDFDGCPSFPGKPEWWSQVMALGDKPVMLTEFGVNREHWGEPFCGDRSAWLADFFSDLASNYPQIAALNYVELDLFPWATVIQPGDGAAQAWRDELTSRPDRWPRCVALADGSEVCRSP